MSNSNEGVLHIPLSWKIEASPWMDTCWGGLTHLQRYIRYFLPAKPTQLIWIWLIAKLLYRGKEKIHSEIKLIVY